MSSISVNFKSPAQGKLVAESLSSTSHVLAVLAPGGGKSVTWEVPGVVTPDQLSIVFSPFTALLYDQLSRSKKLGIVAQRWEPGCIVKDTVSVLFVAWDHADHAQLLEFVIFISIFKYVTHSFVVSRFIKFGESRISRIIIDEFHELLISSSWRPQLWRIKALVDSPIVKILLTGTLPPSFQAQALTMLGINTENQPFKVIRSPTNRPDIRYHLCNVPYGQSMVLSISQIVKKVHARFFHPKSRGIIMCTSKSRCESIATALGCRQCYSDLPNKLEEIERWKYGQTPGDQWIASTSCLATGVSFDGVEWIIFAGSPGSFYVFIQATARGSRYGETCVSLVVSDQGYFSPNSPDYELRNSMSDYCQNTTKCRRQQISSIMDGSDMQVTCATLPGALSCDICDRQSVYTNIIQEALSLAVPSSQMTLVEHLHALQQHAAISTSVSFYLFLQFFTTYNP